MDLWFFFFKKHGVLSIISAGVCWMIWLTRNDTVFRHQYWVDIKMIIRRMNRCIASWKLTATQEDGVNRWCNTWRRLSGRSWQSGPPKENQTEHRVGVLNLGLAFLEVLCSCFFFFWNSVLAYACKVLNCWSSSLLADLWLCFPSTVNAETLVLCF